MENIRNTEWFFKYRSCIEQGNLQNAKEVLLSNIPDDAVIYKYQKGTNRNWNCIAGQIPKLWLSQAGEFNDPFDCAFLYNHHSKEIYDRDTEYKFDAKKGYYLYPEKQNRNSLELRVNSGVSFEKNIVPREDMKVIKHGLLIPDKVSNYEEFVQSIRQSEKKFVEYFCFNYNSMDFIKER